MTTIHYNTVQVGEMAPQTIKLAQGDIVLLYGRYTKAPQIVAHVNDNEWTLISLADGNRYIDPVEDMQKLARHVKQIVQAGTRVTIQVGVVT